MKTKLVFLYLLFVSSFTFAQHDYLLGKWAFEKIPDHVELDEKGEKMMLMFFKDMTLSLDSVNFTQSMMGKTESGTWSLIKDNIYKFNSSKGYSYEAKMKKISDTQIIFELEDQEFQLIKTDEKGTIEIVENSIDKFEGVEIMLDEFIGTWFHNGQIKKGEESGLIFKHKANEVVNYTFKKNGRFINRAPLGIKLKAVWKIENDKKTIRIESKERDEYFKVVKLNAKELHLYNPKNESIIKFRR